MEIKINKEIRDYKESIFFGLSMRQFVFSLCACGMAVLLYFLLKPYCSMETLSWICILGAFPFAILGFVKYNGMNAEEFIVAWFKSEILMPEVLLFKPENIYDELLKNEKEENKIVKFKKRRTNNSKKCTTSNTNKSNI